MATPFSLPGAYSDNVLRVDIVVPDIKHHLNVDKCALNNQRKSNAMAVNQRFCLNEDRYIIDGLNPAAKYLERYEGAPEDDMHLREQVL
jgi:hypothetical protein